MLDSTHEGARSDWISHFLLHRERSHHEPAYFAATALKEIDEVGRFIYRDFYVPSPATAIIEANILTKLATCEAFHAARNVYSYRWAAKSSGNIFQHYYAGFAERNKEAANALADTENGVAVVTDIKNYYPSISRARLLDLLNRQIKSTQLEPRFLTHFERIVCSLLHRTSTAGVPIGPPISHMLGQLALSDVDATLGKMYPKRYFRYVDDIVIVVPKDQADGAIHNVSRILDSEGLLINDSKTEVVTRGQWYGDRYEDGPRFADLMDRLAVYFILNPDTYQAVKAVFQDRGFSLPLGRILTRSKGRRYRRYLRALVDGRPLYQLGGWHRLTQRWSYIADNIDTLVNDAVAIRTDLLQRAERLSAVAVPPSGIERRRFLQECRFVFNRLIYMLSLDEYPKLLSLIPQCRELFESRAAIKALSERNLDQILSLPGAAARTVGELSSELAISLKAPSERAKEDAARASSRAYRDSVAILSLFDTYSPSQKEIEEFPKVDQIYLAFCTGFAGLERELEDFSYLDEIRCLQLGRAHDDVFSNLASRFDDLEDFNFEGLELDGAYYAQ